MFDVSGDDGELVRDVGRESSEEALAKEPIDFVGHGGDLQQHTHIELLPVRRLHAMWSGRAWTV